MNCIENVSKSLFAEDIALSEEEKSLQILIRQMLQTRIFLGNYSERRFVEILSAYRDVIVVDRSETVLIKDIQYVYRRLFRNYAFRVSFWIGISESDIDGIQRLWVEIPNRPFGKYWFTIKTVKFRDNEIILRLKVLREVFGVATEVQESKIKNYELKKCFLEYKEACKQNMLYILFDILTVKNMFKAIHFIAVLLMTGICGGFEAIKFLGDFIIRFLREVSIFIRSATPIFLGVIDFFTKVVGGLYILLSMMWRSNRNSGPPKHYYAINNRGTRPIAWQN